jgi:hypothetical protein
MMSCHFASEGKRRRGRYAKEGSVGQIFLKSGFAEKSASRPTTFRLGCDDHPQPPITAASKSTAIIPNR